jgi:tetratricopeptide (TPR) repeat protein
MMSHLRIRISIALAVLLSVGGAAALSIWQAGGPAPKLNDVLALARVRHFEKAQALLDRYLRAYPDDAKAHMLMAQIATEPPSPQPEVALKHLALLRPPAPSESARIQFFTGKAHYQVGRFDLAEASWSRALKLDFTVPEAGWALMDLLDKEGRVEEAHRLGMQLHESEPDPVDRVRILLEVARLDIETVAPGSQVQLFEQLAREHPDNLPLVLATGLALVHDSRSKHGLKLLEDALKRHPQSADAWDAWLTGLYDAAEFDGLTADFARLPETLARDSRFAKHEGRLAQNARDWPRAVRAYRRAHKHEPFDQSILYRYWLVLRQAGETAEFERIDKVYADYKDAYRQLRGTYFEMGPTPGGPKAPELEPGQRRGVYYETIAKTTLGRQAHTGLYQLLAGLRERLGRTDEARAWHRLVLRDAPDNAASLAALKRLD